jgi:hypothetical protein
MRDWLQAAGAAWRTVSERSDLWLPGALGHLLFLGWLPLLVAVAHPPEADDLAFLGVRLVAASAFPWNVVALVVAMVGALLLLILLAAVVEVVLTAAVARRPGTAAGATATVAVMSVILVAAIPVAGAALALALGIVSVAPDLFLATPSLIEIIGRLLSALWPLIAVLAVLLLLAQTFGAVAIRQVMHRVGPAGALSAAARDLARHPARRLATAAVGMVGDLAALAISVALLSVLWAPIGADLAAGRLLRPATLALLLGFVAIWFALVLTAGVMRTWLTAWWTLEIGSESPGGAIDAS